MEMRGFKQILHLSRSIRLKLCNQAHVPLLLKQQLFGEEPFQGATVPFLIIYLKAMFRLFYLCSLLVCCSCLQEYSTLFILMRDYLTKRWVSSFLLRCVLAVLFTIPYPVCVCLYVYARARLRVCAMPPGSQVLVIISWKAWFFVHASSTRAIYSGWVGDSLRGFYTRVILKQFIRNKVRL